MHYHSYSNALSEPFALGGPGGLHVDRVEGLEHLLEESHDAVLLLATNG